MAHFNNGDGVEEKGMKVTDSNEQEQVVTTLDAGTVQRVTRVSSIIMVLVAGLALFSDGYNAQVIGYCNPMFVKLYPDVFTKTIKTRLSNAYLIGEIFGMLFFGYTIDIFGRRTGIFFATIILVFGVILATAAHGKTPLGMFWMMIVGRGVAGFGAGGKSQYPRRYLRLADDWHENTGEYPTCGTGSAEASDETDYVRRQRGMLVAVATDFAIDLGFVMAGVVVLIVLAAYHQNVNDGVWRVSFGLGFVLPISLLFFRIRLLNSSQYRKHAMKHSIPYLLVLRRYWKPMIGTSLAWFFYDFVVGLYFKACY
jgi:MFS family permease